MGYKRPYEEKEHEFRDPYEELFKPSEMTSLNKFQDQLRKENEEIDKILEQAWETHDKSVLKQAKKLKKEIKEALRDITNLKISTSQKIKKRSTGPGTRIKRSKRRSRK